MKLVATLNQLVLCDAAHLWVEYFIKLGNNLHYYWEHRWATDLLSQSRAQQCLFFFLKYLNKLSMSMSANVLDLKPLNKVVAFFILSLQFNVWADGILIRVKNKNPSIKMTPYLLVLSRLSLFPQMSPTPPTNTKSAIPWPKPPHTLIQETWLVKHTNTLYI